MSTYTHMHEVGPQQRWLLGVGPRSWLAAYGGTLLWELPALAARYVVAFAVAAVALLVTGHDGASASTWAKLGLVPTAWSLASLASGAPGGWLWQVRAGGRVPTVAEGRALRAAMERLGAAGAELWAGPRKWFVVDETAVRSAVRGDTLMVTRGALESEYLPALVAHELGHLRSIDARLMAAVERLEVPLPGGRWLALLRGGWGVRMMAPAWGAVWREAQYRADAYAAQLGEGEALADFLELHEQDDERPQSWAWLRGQASPPVALRVQRLRAAACGDGEVA